MGGVKQGDKAERQARKAARRAEKQKRHAAPDETAEQERLVSAFEREEREGANEDSRRLLAAEPPVLDDVQRELAGRLSSDGIARIRFDELFPAERWPELEAHARTFTNEVEERLAADPTRKRGKAGFLERRYDRGVEIDPGDPWLRVGLSARLLDVVNSYLGLWAKLTYLDQWYTVPMPDGAARRASQNWHRDHNDRNLVKVFVHLSDVDGGAGPFEYVAGSTRDGPYARFRPWEPFSRHYPPGEEFDERIPASAIRTLTGPAGTMILCDTSGFHRGGFATERPRILWRYNYTSPASLVLTPRRFTIAGARLPADLSPAARFAVG